MARDDHLLLSTQVADLKVRIVGAGVAGLSCALALRQRTGIHDITVFERESHETLPRKLGHGLLLMQNGVRALNELGIGRVLDACTPIERAVFRDASGVPLRVDAKKDVYCVTRSALVEAMRTTLADGVLQLGTRVRDVRLKPSPDGRGDTVAALVFADGRVEPVGERELVIGAEGVHSALCHALNPKIQRPLSRVKEIVTSAEMPELAQQLRGTFLKTQFPDRGLAFGLLAPTSTRVIGFLQFDSERYAAPQRDASGEDYRAFLLSLLADAPEPVASYLHLVDLESAHVWHPIDAQLPKHLHCDNAVLVGDAAHPLLPFTSQGVSAALEDSIILADVLRATAGEFEPLAMVLKGFTTDRRRDMAAYIAGGQNILRSFVDNTRGFTLPYVDGAASKLEQHLALPKGSLRQLLQVLDANGDGSLERREFEFALELFGAHASKTEAADLFQELDLDQDGQLNLDELLLGLGGPSPEGSHLLETLRARLSSPRELSIFTTRSRLASLFRMLDSERKGLLDFEGFRAATAGLGVLYTPDDARRAFDEVDSDGDGGVTLDDLCTGLERGQLRTSEELSERLIRLSDAPGAPRLSDG